MIEDRCFWKWFVCNYSLYRLYLSNFFRLLHLRDALCKEIESDRREVGTNPIYITLTNQSHSDILEDIIPAINIIAWCFDFFREGSFRYLQIKCRGSHQCNGFGQEVFARDNLYFCAKLLCAFVNILAFC